MSGGGSSWERAAGWGWDVAGPATVALGLFCSSLAGCDEASSSTSLDAAAPVTPETDALVPPGPSDAASEGGSVASDANVPTGLTPHATRVSLLDHLAWSRMSPADDPFGDAPESVYCLDTSTVAESLGGELSYDVDTRDCNYVTVQQPSRDHVAAGETIAVKLAHFELTAPSQSEAHLSVRLGDVTLLDERVPIPSPAAVLEREIVASEDIPSGTPLFFHVHNHGENSYALVRVSTGP